MEKYILVGFPEIQHFMVREDFSECVFVNDIKVEDSSYFVPEVIYREVFGNEIAEVEDKYIFVSFPDSQFIESEDILNECIFVNDEDVQPCSYFVPESLYREVYK